MAAIPFKAKVHDLFDRTWAVTVATSLPKEIASINPKLAGLQGAQDRLVKARTDGDAVLAAQLEAKIKKAIAEITVEKVPPTIVPGTGLKITELDVKFKIEKTTEDKPNTCELTIYNLTEDQRSQIEQLNPETKEVSKFDKGKVKEAARKQATRGIPVKIEAGYGGDNSLLWLGDLRSCHSERNGPDWLTIFKSGDGEKAYQNARMNVSYGPKTPLDTAMRAMVKSLKIAEGNTDDFAKKLRIDGKFIPVGTVFSGPTRDMLNDFCRSTDLEWSIQEGAIQFIDRGKALDGKAIKVSEKTGMLNSPSVDVDGILKVKTLMIPDIRPGRLLVLDSRRIKGNFKIEKITWEADSAGGEWGLEILAVRY